MMDDKIPNMELYNKRMSRTMIDKIFFLSHIDDNTKIFVDFGCANGEMLKVVSNFIPDGLFIGYDISVPMLKKAQENVGDDKRFGFTNSLQTLESILQRAKKYNGKRTCLILSSVIHEVYSYSPTEEVKKFWKFVNDSGFDYIAIREMTYDRILNNLPVYPPTYKILKENTTYNEEFKEFEKTWGTIRTSQKKMIHFLLKYIYKGDNWEREVKENYLPLDFETLKRKISNTKYKPVFEHSYMLPYIRRRVWEDFRIYLHNTTTHCKLLYEKYEKD